jgi:transposase-like protein
LALSSRTQRIAQHLRDGISIQAIAAKVGVDKTKNQTYAWTKNFGRHFSVISKKSV